MDGMDAKHPLVSPAPKRPTRQFRWKVLAWPLASIILLYTLIPNLRARLLSLPCHGSNRVTYEGESISWEPCGEITGHPLECSNLTVPMNHFAPAKSSGAQEEDKVFTIPLIRMRAKNATQNLIINPGGPGGSGVLFVYAIGDELNTILDEGYHILSFDPRGVNGSRPRAECYPDDATRRAHSMPRSGRISDTGEMYAWNKNLARACYDTMGEHAEYSGFLISLSSRLIARSLQMGTVNTPQTAADMNSILDAVGQEDMLYWGFSYGTTLGQTYATMYPERSRRIVIDGVANINDTYSRLDPDQKQFSDTDRVLYGFFDECAKAGPDRCPLAAFGGTADDVWEAVLSRVDALRDEPLSVYVNSTVYGTFDYPNFLTNAIFYSLYSPKKAWPPVAEQLAKFLQGNATDIWMEHGRADVFASIGEANRFVNFNDAKSGPGYWPQGRQDVVDEIERVANGSLFSRIDMTGFFGRQQ